MSICPNCNRRLMINFVDEIEIESCNNCGFEKIKKKIDNSSQSKLFG